MSVVVIALGGCGLDSLLEDEHKSSRSEQDNAVAEAVTAPKPASTSEVPGKDVYCYERYRTLSKIVQRSSKPVPEGYQWHHIVNQNPTNKKRFGTRLHCTDNLIALPVSVHRKISGFYNSKQKWSGRRRVREVINDRSWSEQYEFGLATLRDHGIDP